MFSYEIWEIFKSTYFEQHLRKTASTINSNGEFGLDETSTECKVSSF